MEKMQTTMPSTPEKEKVVLRKEHSRSIEDAERLRAKHYLEEVNFLQRVDETATYHGRSDTASASDTWRVDPRFQDQGNLIKKSALYASGREDAQDFAKARAKSEIKNLYWSHLEEVTRQSDPSEYYTHIYNDRVARQEARRIQNQNEGKVTITESPVDRELLTRTEWKDYDIWAATKWRESKMSQEQKNDLWKDLVSQSDLVLSTHHIASHNPDATLLNVKYSIGDDPEQDQKVGQAWRTLVPKYSQTVPVAFREREALPAVTSVIDAYERKQVERQGFCVELSDKEVDLLIAENGLPVDVSRRLFAAWNAEVALSSNPTSITSKYEKTDQEFFYAHGATANPEDRITYATEYISRAFHEMEVIGTLTNVNSATLNKRIADVAVLFDLDKVQTKKILEQEKESVTQSFAEIGHALLAGLERSDHALVKSLLTDLYLDPQDIVKGAEAVDGYSEFFQQDAGNWEGFTLGEHTETVLRNFDESFADEVHHDILPIMRLALLSHDLGKPEAVRDNRKKDEQKYNVRESQKFFTALGLDSKTIQFVHDLYTVQYTYADFYLHKDPVAEKKLGELAEQALMRYGIPSTHDNRVGIVKMGKILFSCDGGAYTEHATTRVGEDGHYRNHPSFNSSFEKPTDLAGRKIQLKKSQR